MILTLENFILYLNKINQISIIFIYPYIIIYLMICMTGLMHTLNLYKIEDGVKHFLMKGL